MYELTNSPLLFNVVEIFGDKGNYSLSPEQANKKYSVTSSLTNRKSRILYSDMGAICFKLEHFFKFILNDPDFYH